ncbi:integrase [Bifidobacterium tissieri]|uniref:Integrase n=1 Tax=Bifidobacterium tissieri TaxID=1630162 RepID=A0A5M9ZQX5_9BIFI|nr:integrase [Bifidobacterium tissieri]KAA8830056.1 integrase [Bifidobacterium tissieri]KAA8831263.1 integrase [Bifidobacterium tissieri]
MLDEYMIWHRDKHIQLEYGMSIIDKHIQLRIVV